MPLCIKVRALCHLPVMFEWQLELAYLLMPRSPQWSPEVQGLHAFRDNDKSEQAMDMYIDIFDDNEGMQYPDIVFQTVTIPTQAVGWTAGYNTQSIVSTSLSPSGFPVQPLLDSEYPISMLMLIV